MRRLILGLTAASMLGVPATSAPAALSPAVEKDLQCFMLFAIAAQQASEAKDEKAQQAVGMAVTYYFGRLGAEAPTLDLHSAIEAEAQKMQGNPKTKDAGTRCDAEFQKVGTDLQNLGSGLKNQTTTASR